MPTRGEAANSAGATDLANRRLAHLIHQRVKIEWIAGTSKRVARYVGWADPSATTAQKKWRIVRVTWDAFDNPTDVEWPDGSIAYAYAWTDRSGLDYVTA